MTSFGLGSVLCAGEEIETWGCSSAKRLTTGSGMASFGRVDSISAVRMSLAGPSAHARNIIGRRPS